jgi:Domain of unknown function (DUF4294)
MLHARWFLLVLITCNITVLFAQFKPVNAAVDQHRDSASRRIYNIGEIKAGDSVPTVNLREVQIVTFKTQEEWAQYYTYKARIEKVMPYVKIARELYVELREKEDTSRRRDYRHYRKDLEKEMRAKFEKELKDLTKGQGEMLFKLINRETGNNCYKLIKDVKGPIPAWMAQMLARHWGYDLKETYDPEKERMIELIIKQMGPNYKG